MNFRWIALVIALVSLPVISGSSAPILSARPGLCIIQDPAATDCVMALELRWNAANISSYCLHHSQSPEPLQCWTATRRGQHHIELKSREDVSYWLQETQRDQHLAQITVRIVSLAQRQPQRRRRHVWSIM